MYTAVADARTLSYSIWSGPVKIESMCEGQRQLIRDNDCLFEIFPEYRDLIFTSVSFDKLLKGNNGHLSLLFD